MSHIVCAFAGAIVIMCLIDWFGIGLKMHACEAALQRNQHCKYIAVPDLDHNN